MTHVATRMTISFFPKVKPAAKVSPDIRAAAVDYVNRVNWLFETWDLEAMVDAFLPDARVFHFHGSLDGEKEIRGSVRGRGVNSRTALAGIGVAIGPCG